MKNKNVSFVVPTLNLGDMLKGTLVSLIATIPDYVTPEFIIVDNGSTEPIKPIVSEITEKTKIPCRIIRNENNIGVSKAWNQGIKAATGDYVAVINNDLEFGVGWLDVILKLFERESKLWCVCPDYTRIDKPRNFPELSIQRLRNQNVYLSSELVGFCFILSRECISGLTKKDGFVIDEQFDMLWYEDSDLWERLNMAGHPPVKTSQALIHHYESKTLVTIPNKEKYMEGNYKRFLKKHPKSSLKTYVPPSMRKTICIAVPTMGKICTDLMERLIYWMTYNIRYNVVILTSTSLVFHDYARNVLTERFLTETKADYLMFIDSDIIPPYNVLQMADYNYPLVGAVCFAWQGGQNIATIYNKLGSKYTPDANAKIDSGLQEVVVTGMACALIRRDVMEAMKQPYFQFIYGKEKRNLVKGEDTWFCENVRRLGHKIYIDTSLICSHLKEIDLKQVAANTREFGKQAAIRVASEYEAKYAKCEPKTGKIATKRQK